jgi:hypothetical protein
VSKLKDPMILEALNSPHDCCSGENLRLVKTKKKSAYLRCKVCKNRSPEIEINWLLFVALECEWN